MPQEKAQNLEDLLDELGRAAEGEEKVSVRKLHEAIGTRSFGPLLIAPGLAAVTPLGVIPGVPSLLALMVILVAGQLVLGREQFWLPRFFLDRRIKAERVQKTVRMARPVARFIDRLIKPRLQALTGPVATRVIAGVCVLVSLTIPPLELIPLGALAPGIAVAAFGLGLIARDGVLVVLALIASATTLALAGMALLR